jgi:hypothetical protein
LDRNFTSSKLFGNQEVLFYDLSTQLESITTTTLWRRLIEDQEAYQTLRNQSNMRWLLENYMLPKKIAIKDKTDEFPKFKKSGIFFLN